MGSRVKGPDGPAPDHDAIKWNRIMISSLCLSMIFSENRFPLCANAAVPVLIML